MEAQYDSSWIGPAQASVFRTSDEIEEDVRELINANTLIQPKDIDVEVEDGRVTLRGRVATLEAAQEAEQAAREVIGVTEVINELEVAP